MTLIELMVSIAIGMLMIAALASLIASQSSNRAEIDKSGRMIENGRYALQTMASDVQLAGYWGELNPAPAPPAVLPNPCNVTVAGLETSMGLHVQGYESPAALPAPVNGCVTNHKPGTDVFVVRRVDPDSSGVETAAGATDLSKLKEGQIYLQTGLNPAGTTVTKIMAIGSSSTTTNSTTFALTKKDRTSISTLRKVVVNIYYVSTCSVCTGGGDGIPTLKRVELGVTGGAPAFGNPMSIAEGIENLQVDYGVDSDGNGSSDGVDVNGAALAAADWANVMTLKIHLLARANDATAGFTDSKTYSLGTAAAASAPTGSGKFKRHVFVQSVRLMNPSGRRLL